MTCILNIESSTNVCSITISSNGTCLYNQEDYNGPNHSTLLPVFISEAYKFSRDNNFSINAVSISMGPGSYTGLRIGTSLAKGFCFGKEIPLIAISTLEILCVPILLYQKIPDNALLCPMIDARRMEVYTALYDKALKQITPIEAKEINSYSFSNFLAERPIYFFGNGSEKCKHILTHYNAIFLKNVFPLAKNMFSLAEKKLIEKKFVDTAYFEPFYLKEFVPTIAKRKL